MTIETILNLLPAGAQVYPDACLREFTTFQLGGACKALVDCSNAEALIESAQVLSAHGVAFVVIGQGSNLLVADAGLDRVVLRYCSEIPNLTFSADVVTVSGNTLLHDFAFAACEKGVGDVSFCCGIPGTVGGAIAGNAGAFGKQIGDVVASARLMDSSGVVREVSGEELAFAYRTSILKRSDGVVLEATLQLEVVDRKEVVAECERIMALRRAKHPDWHRSPCAGSVFRNLEPTSAAGRRQAAGWFLEEAGAKAFRVGGAKLFDHHANIIVAESGATASDVYKLTERMIAAVQDQFGFELQREIELMGVFDGEDKNRR